MGRHGQGLDLFEVLCKNRCRTCNCIALVALEELPLSFVCLGSLVSALLWLAHCTCVQSRPEKGYGDVLTVTLRVGDLKSRQFREAHTCVLLCRTISIVLYLHFFIDRVCRVSN